MERGLIEIQSMEHEQKIGNVHLVLVGTAMIHKMGMIEIIQLPSKRENYMASC